MDAPSAAGHEGGGIVDGLRTLVSAITPGRQAKRTKPRKKARTAGQSTATGTAKKAAKTKAAKTTAQKSRSSPAISIAVDIGWTMAVLYGPQRGLSYLDERLPTEHELPPDQRIELETKRLRSLVDQLAELAPKSAGPKPEVPQIPAVPGSADEEAGQNEHAKDNAGDAARALIGMSQDNLEKTNLLILEWLACAGREFSLAYQLGRSLRDTANPPIRSAPADDESRLTAVQACTNAIEAGHGRAAELRGTTLQDKAKAEIRSKVYDQARRDAIQRAARAKEITDRASAITAARDRAEKAGTQLPDDQMESPEDQARRELEVRDALTIQLGRPRVAKLQEWLAVLGPHLPPDSAAIVSVSMGRWCDLVTTIFVQGTPGKLRRHGRTSPLPARDLAGSTSRFTLPSPLDIATELHDSLLPQGDAWLNLLVGAESSEGLLTPEGFVAAAEAALSRTARIIRKIVYHYWFALLIVAAALGGILYFAAHDLGGAGKLWTQIAAVAGALGITARGIGATMADLSKEAERPIFGLEKVDAMAWAVTTIPADLKLSIRGVRALRRSGIPQSSPLGRV